MGSAADVDKVMYECGVQDLHPDLVGVKGVRKSDTRERPGPRQRRSWEATKGYLPLRPP